MIKGIEHLGIAVQDLEKSEELFEKLLGQSHYKRENVDSEGVEVSFLQTGGNKLELLQGVTEDSAITKYINKKGEGIQHVAFAVDDIYAEIKRLKGEGFTFLNEDPKAGADNKLICFLHPKTTNGVLVELCQERSD